jgi:hypothetical protein
MCREDKQFDPFAETPVDGVIAAQVNQSHSVFIESFVFCRLFVDFLLAGFPFVFGVSPVDLIICSLHSKHAGGGDLDLHFFRPLHPLKGTIAWNGFLT